MNNLRYWRKKKKNLYLEYKLFTSRNIKKNKIIINTFARTCIQGVRKIHYFYLILLDFYTFIYFVF